MIEVEERPLLTFALVAYNQEKYIREAVEGALAQTYHPLEIILSDDGSRDSTYEIISSLAASYRGSHCVKIRRNASNLGLARHLETVATLARGTFLVLGAGDDISTPDRVAEIVARTASGRDVKCFYSAYTKIDEVGNYVGDYSQTAEISERLSKLSFIMSSGTANVTGATTAYHRDVFRLFDALPQELYQEDQVLPVRALLLGDIVYSPKPLVKYRLTRTSIWRNLNVDEELPETINRERRLAKYRQTLLVFRTWQKDIERACNSKLLEIEQGKTLLRRLATTERIVTERFLALQGPYFIRVWSALKLLVLKLETPTPTIRYRARRLVRSVVPFYVRRTLGKFW